MTHRALANLLSWQRHEGLPRSAPRTLQFAPLSFDVSFQEILSTWATGGTLVLTSEALRRDPKAMLAFLRDESIDRLFLPFVALQQLAEVAADAPLPRALREVITAGEQLRITPQIAAFFGALPGCELHNHYGPTESHVVTALRLHGPASTWPALPSIGRPIANTRIHILDDRLRPVPVGVFGQLFITGAALARGYAHQPGLTAERFVPSPVPGERAYATGDVGRFLPDGTIQLAGRRDNQIKIRGYRVELGEIEAVLAQHPVVSSVAVVTWGDGASKRLVAYFAATTPLSSDALRDFAKEQLPEYMVPSQFVVHDALPLTSSGKVDRRALPEVPLERAAAVESAPTHPLEAQIAEIWSEVLDVTDIGADENFFELGGNSLLATRVMSRVHAALGIDLPVRTLFEAPTVAQLSRRLAKHIIPGVAGSSIPAIDRSVAMPLSYAQEGLWFLHQLEVGASGYNYNVPAGLRLQGRLNLRALKSALGVLVARHETLRSVIRAIDGMPQQIVQPARPVALPLIDLWDVSDEELDAEIARRARREAEEPFDLEQGPLLRATLLRRREDDHVLLLTMHHLTVDGWSFGVLFAELARAYETFCVGKEPELPPLAVQYGDFAAWQRERLTGAKLEEHLAYWKEQLAGAPAALDLPIDHVRAAVQVFRGASHTFRLSASLTREIESFSRSHGATLFMTLLAAFDALLARYSGQSDIVVGAPIANRNHTDLEGLIGFFANTLALRTDLSGDPSFAELVGRVRDVTLGAYSHQDLPFGRLVEALHPARDLSRNPIFQAMFVLQNQAMDAPALRDLDLSILDPHKSHNGTSKFDVWLSMAVDGEQLVGVLEYDTGLFEAATTRRMVGHFESLLEAAIAAPAAPLSELPLLDAEERRQLLVDWNATAADLGGACCLHELVSAQMARTPDAIALKFGDETLSYGELDRRTNQLAHALVSLGAGPETRVGVCMLRSLEMVVALVGVLKAGAAYVPLDPSYPAQRLAFMLEDARPAVLLTQRAVRDGALAGLELAGPVVCLDSEWPQVAAQPTSPLSVRVRPENLAYVIYTSGSTGRPKGAMNTHAAIVNRLRWMQATFGLTEADCVLQKTPFGFDVSVWEFFWPLMTGARLVIARPEGHADPQYLVRTIIEQGVTVLHFVPSMLRLFLEESGVAACGSLRAVVCSGEALPPALVHRSRALLSAEVHNLYGPTEAAIDVSHWAAGAEWGGRVVPIGKPISNLRLYVLDRMLRPVPIGVAGELHIAGVGLARGYLQRPGLTAERFVPDPVSGLSGSRLYRTGDRARYLANGDIEYLGRLDDQIKLRGFRIELGEVENALRCHPAVREAAVRLLEQPEPHLVAYVVPAEAPATGVDGDVRTERLSEWRDVFDQTYRHGESDEAGEDFAGWRDSYTGEPIARDAMRVWVAQTVERIMALAPTSVLELGCGTGLILRHVAPHCARYVGTDPSAVAMADLAARMRHLAQVDLQVASAHEIAATEVGRHDVIVLNSVVQYFPDVDYLLAVIENALRALGRRGTIFIGDVRSLPLMHALHVSIELAKATPETPASTLVERVARRTANERELLIDPAFFVALCRRFERIRDVEILHKRGRDTNELNRYRYDVVLHVSDEPSHDAQPTKVVDGSGLSIDELCRVLDAEQPEALLVTGVPNARLAEHLRATELLKSAAARVATIRASAQATGLDPEDYWRIADGRPYRVSIVWSGPERDSTFDVLLVHRGAAPTFARYAGGDACRPWRSYTNEPMRAALGRAISSALRAHLQQTLPVYMVPSRFIELDRLPLSPNGKVDLKALPMPPSVAAAPGGGEVNSVLAGIWCDLLGVEHVGSDENFFDLGGHSLLLAQVRNRIRVALGHEISLVDLLTHTTLRGLSAHLDASSRPDASVASSRDDLAAGRRRVRERMRRTTAESSGS